MYILSLGLPYQGGASEEQRGRGGFCGLVSFLIQALVAHYLLLLVLLVGGGDPFRQAVRGDPQNWRFFFA